MDLLSFLIDGAHPLASLVEHLPLLAASVGSPLGAVLLDERSLLALIPVPTWRAPVVFARVGPAPSPL